MLAKKMGQTGGKQIITFLTNDDNVMPCDNELANVLARCSGNASYITNELVAQVPASGHCYLAHHFPLPGTRRKLYERLLQDKSLFEWRNML